MATTNFSPSPRRSNLSNTLYVYERGFGPTPKSSPVEKYQSPYLANLNNDGGLAATAAASPTPSIDPYQQYRDGYNDAQQKINPPLEQPATAYRSGPSEKVANYTAMGGLGLGVLSYLENRKTAKIQRESMKQDLATAREHNQNRRDSLASFNSGW